MSLGHLYFMFMRYGLLCFGGGYVLVPLFVHELVEEKAALSREMFGNLVAIAQMTPGPIGVNTATFVGYTQGGVFGAIIGTLGLLTPALFLVSCTVASFRRWEKHWVVQGLLNGVRPVTLAMILSAVVIFAELSVFTAPLPHRLLWPILMGNASWSDFFAGCRAVNVRWMAALIAVVSGVMIHKTKIKVLWIIIGASLFGALWWGVLVR